MKSKKKLTINNDEMKSFLQSYDVLKQKYCWDTDNISIELMEQIVSLSRRNGGRKVTWDSEKAKDTYLAVRDIYGDDTQQYLDIIPIVLEKFVGDYVGIEGIEYLCMSSYFYFEWLMHLEYDADKHAYKRYRDHYVHQIKNMYEMFVLLDDYGYMDYCRQSYQQSTSYIAERIRNSIADQIKDNQREENAIVIKLIIEKGIERTEEKVQKRKEDYYYQYLFHAVAIVAALVHDIGYPIAYMLRKTEELHDFLPLSGAFLHLNDAMPHFEDILQNSLLYQTVEPQKIAKRIRERKDHGAISAVILLSKYYETGAIYKLAPVERMVIELAAVVIYNHTLRYAYMGQKREDCYRNLFEDNPISYLFRLCDDIQEWGRVYFDISKKSNFLICSKCHMPIIRNKWDSRNAGLTPEKNPNYICACGVSGGRSTRFSYRKMTNISACDCLEIDKLKSGDKCEDKREQIRISMKYNLVSMLQLSLYDPYFAKQRADGIYEVKRMLHGQKMIPMTYIDTFITNNPIAIKVQCLENFLQYYVYKGKATSVWQEPDFVIVGNDIENSSDKEAYIYQQVIEKFSQAEGEKLSEQAGLILDEICSKKEWQLNDGGDLCSVIKRKWIQNLVFYLMLAIIGENIEKIRQAGYLYSKDPSDNARKEARNRCLGLSKQLAELISEFYHIGDRYTTILICDYIWQRIRRVTEGEYFAHKALDYYEEAFLSNQAMANAVEEYVESDLHVRVWQALRDGEPNEVKGIYDYYTDYELFAVMGNIACEKD